jgi:hypothetical protein
MDHVDLSLMHNDTRPPFMLYDVAGAQIEHIRAQAAAGVPLFMLNKVTDFSIEKAAGLPDTRRDKVDQESIAGTNVPVPGSTFTNAVPAENLPASANTPIAPARAPAPGQQ